MFQICLQFLKKSIDSPPWVAGGGGGFRLQKWQSMPHCRNGIWLRKACIILLTIHFRLIQEVNTMSIGYLKYQVIMYTSSWPIMCGIKHSFLMSFKREFTEIRIWIQNKCFSAFEKINYQTPCTVNWWLAILILSQDRRIIYRSNYYFSFRTRLSFF